MTKYSQYHKMYISAYNINTTHSTACPALIHIQIKWAMALPMEMSEVDCSSISGIGIQPRVLQTSLPYSNQLIGCHYL